MDRHPRLIHPAAFAGLVAAAVFYVYVLAIQDNNLIDDAYIAFRYAHNLAEGKGLVFNAGERILAATSPLYCLVLAGADRVLSLPPDRAAPLAGAVFSAAGLVLFGALLAAARTGLWGPALGVSLFTFDNLVFDYFTSGLETPLLVCLTLGFFLAAWAGRARAAAMLLSLVCLTRPDGMLLVASAALVAVIPIVKSRCVSPASLRRWLLPLIIFAAPLVLWSAVATWYYGTPIPNSATSKLLATSWTGFAGFLLGYAAHFSRFLPVDSIPEFARVILGSAVIAAVVLTCLKVNARLFALPATYLLVYMTGAVAVHPPPHGWYAVMPRVLAILFFAAAVPVWVQGLLRLAPGVSRRFPRGWHSVGAMAHIAVIAWIAWSLRGDFNFFPGQQRRFTFQGAEISRQRERAYVAAARRVNAVMKPGETAGIGEIGAFGYFCPARIIEMNFTLTRPEFRDLVRRGLPVDRYALEKYRPDYYVARDDFLENNGPPLDQYLGDHYQALDSIPFGPWGVRYVRVYRRKD